MIRNIVLIWRIVLNESEGQVCTYFQHCVVEYILYTHILDDQISISILLFYVYTYLQVK